MIPDRREPIESAVMADSMGERVAADTRRQRIDRLRAIVEEIFPGEGRRGLRENVERSFSVPQVGEYHKEGMFMDSHLDLITQNIEAVARGEFPTDILPAAREALQRAVRRDPDSVKKYVFLHDIAKADCLTLKVDGEERAVTWDEWQAMLAGSESGRRAAAGDERALRDFCAEQGIIGVSYFQNQGEAKRQHGKMGAEELRAIGDMNETMLAAIEAHEVAYQFQGIKVSTYEKYFDGLSEDARDFAMLASYVDTMASLRTDGNPDLSNFLALAASREKSETLAELARRIAGAKLDKQKFERAWAALRNSDDPLSSDQIDAAEARLRAECKLAGYDVDKLRSAVEPLLANGTLTEDERDRLLEMAASNPQGIGKAFGPKMRHLAPCLKQAQI